MGWSEPWGAQLMMRSQEGNQLTESEIALQLCYKRHPSMSSACTLLVIISIELGDAGGGG